MKTESLNKVICCVSGVVFLLQAVGYLAPAWFVQEVLVLPDFKGMHADGRHFLLPFLYQKEDGTMSLLGGQALFDVGENDIKTQGNEGDPSLVPDDQNNPNFQGEMQTNGENNVGTNIDETSSLFLKIPAPSALGTVAPNLPDSGFWKEGELNANEEMITPVAEFVKPILGLIQRTTDFIYDLSTTTNTVVQEDSTSKMSSGLSKGNLMVGANKLGSSADDLSSTAKRQRRRRAADIDVEPHLTIVETNVDPNQATENKVLLVTTQTLSQPNVRPKAPIKPYTEAPTKTFVETVNETVPISNPALVATPSRTLFNPGGSLEASATSAKPGNRGKNPVTDSAEATTPPLAETFSSRIPGDSFSNSEEGHGQRMKTESKGEQLLLYLTAGLWYSVACVTIRYSDMRSDADAMQWCTLYTRIDNDTLENKHNVFELRLESSIGMAFSLMSVVLACTGCCTRRHLGRRAISSIAVLFLSGAIMAIPVVHVIVQHVQLHNNVVRKRQWKHVTKNLHVAHDLFDHYSVILCGVASIISVLSAVVFTLITCKSSAADDSRYDLESASGFTRSVKKYPVTWVHNASITVPALTVSKVENKADDSESGYSDIKDDTVSEYDVTMHERDFAMNEIDFTLHEGDCDENVATVESGQPNTD